MKDLLKKIHHRLYFCLAVNFLILLFFATLYLCRFETCDDFIMKMIASGSYTEGPDYHLIHINSVLGRLLVLLYKINGSFAWYDALHYAVTWLSLSTITYVLVNHFENRDLFVYLAVFAIGYSFYTSVQFTKTVALPAVAGHLLIADSIEKKRKAPYYALGVILLLLSSMFRKQQFYACSFLCIPLYVGFFLDLIPHFNDRDRLTKVKRLIITGIAALILVTGASLIDKADYSSQEWKDYRTYNSVRGSLLDFGMPEYQDNVELYDSIGMDENFYELMLRCNFYDSDVYDIEKAEKLITERERYIDFTYVFEFAYNFVSYFFSNKDILIHTMMLVTALVLYFLNPEKKTYLNVFLLMVFLLIDIFVCYHIRQMNFYARIEISFLSIAFFEILYFTIRSEKKIPLLSVLMICLIVFITLNGHWFKYLNYNCGSYYAIEEQKKKIPEMISADKDHLYVYQTLDRFWNNETLFDDISYLDFENILSLGEWTTISPLVLSTMEKYGVTNPFKDIIDNEKIYLFIHKDDEMLDRIMAHIQNYHDKDAKLEKVKEIEDYIVYHVVTK